VTPNSTVGGTDREKVLLAGVGLVQEGRSISEVARTFNVHPATIHRCLSAIALERRHRD
jgi:transposase